MNNYKDCDAVWCLNEQRKEGVCQKLQPLYIGPCIVLKKFNSLTYCVQMVDDGPARVLNHDKLKPYRVTTIQNGAQLRFGHIGNISLNSNKIKLKMTDKGDATQCSANI